MSDVSDVIPAVALPRVPVVGGGSFPVHRIYCVGRNFADHAREMGAAVPAADDRGRPMFFSKPADAIVIGHDDVIPYPPATANLHHEVELVVAIGRDARRRTGRGRCRSTGLRLRRRPGPDPPRPAGCGQDKGHPWDAAKGFDASAPISEIVHAEEVGDLAALNLSLEVNGEVRQQALLDQMIWNVPEILHELSKLWQLRAGDLVFMGTPSGVAALKPGDRFSARLENVAERHGVIAG